MPFDNLYRKIAAIESFDLVTETMSIIRENEDTILSLVRGQMGSKGTTVDGKFIKAKFGNTYRDRTVFNKEQHGVGLGKKTDHITLFMTGEFYASLQIAIAGTTFNITSNVPHFKEINAWNENKLLGLDKQNLLYFRDNYIIPQLRERFKAKSK